MPSRLPTLEQFRQRLTHFDALPQLVFLGILTGLATGGVILLFRFAIELPQQWLLPAGISEHFESLSPWQRLALPILGSLLIITLLFSLPASARTVGIPHLLERLNYHQGRIPPQNLLYQFFSAALALNSGHSVGREGPAVYLGGVCGSLLGQKLGLPNNTLRVLIGCGSAAAIAAVFNTPLAGVIFAMEVILLEYSILGFIPIIVAAVTADVLVQLLTGQIDTLPRIELANEFLSDIPFLMLLGLATGLIAALFIFTLQQTLQLRRFHLALRILCAGLITGAVGYFLPEVMGTGYDSISALLEAPPLLGLLLTLLLAKTLLTPLVIGLGIPGGLIGPSLVIGALTGALLATLGNYLGFELSLPLFTLIGMGTMMGAVLNAPLAALLALLELTDNSAVIMPGMLAIVISNLTLRSLLQRPSAFQAILEVQGLQLNQAPLAQALSRAAVGSLMNRDYAICDSQLNPEQARLLLGRRPQWLVLEHNQRFTLMSPGDLTSWLERHPELQEPIDLLQIPASRRDAVSIPYSATLFEAWQLLEREQTPVLLVLSNRNLPLGVITKEHLEAFYNFRQAV